MSLQPWPLFALAIIIVLPAPNANGEDASSDRSFTPTVCDSEACQNASQRLQEAMDQTADPCQDFNQFACGGFIAHAVIPEDKGRQTNFDVISKEIYRAGRELLEESITDQDWQVYKKAKRFYESCMDEGKREELGLKPLKDLLAQLGGWPVVEGSAWDPNNEFSWPDVTYQLDQMGLGGGELVDVDISQDSLDPSRRVIYLDQPGLGMDREYLVKGANDTDVKHYLKYMISAAELMGANRQAAEQEMAKVLDFEIELANALDPKEERRNETKLYNPVTLGDFPSLPGHPTTWTKFVDTIVDCEKIDPTEVVIVRSTKYFPKLSAILAGSGAGTTTGGSTSVHDARTLANYLVWRAVMRTFGLLNEKAGDVEFEYVKAMTGAKKDRPMWKECVQSTGFSNYDDNSFMLAAGSMYARRYFPKEAKDNIMNMVKYVKRAFGDILENLDWMDEETKAKAKTKLGLMQENIAYTDQLLDEALMDNYHSSLSMDKEAYLSNVLQMDKWSGDNVCSRLREPVDRTDWRDHSLVAVVNAFYNPADNGIQFPAGILRGVFYNKDVVPSLNFGGVGAVIGHEITHGFDDSGSQYDGLGRLTDWWNPTTSKKFLNKTKCMIDQYSDFFDQQVGLHLNGIVTQGENIADNGGIKEAYNAFESWLSENGHKELALLLPGLPYSPRQLFWIGFGQNWCAKYRDGTLKNQIMTDPHAPSEFRIKGPLSNSELFARDFKCPLGSPMNPKKKCHVW